MVCCSCWMSLWARVRDRRCRCCSGDVTTIASGRSCCRRDAVAVVVLAAVQPVTDFWSAHWYEAMKHTDLFGFRMSARERQSCWKGMGDWRKPMLLRGQRIRIVASIVGHCSPFAESFGTVLRRMATRKTGHGVCVDSLYGTAELDLVTEAQLRS